MHLDIFGGIFLGEHFDVRGFELKMTVVVFVRVYKTTTTTVIFNAFSYFWRWAAHKLSMWGIGCTRMEGVRGGVAHKERWRTKREGAQGGRAHEEGGRASWADRRDRF